MQGADSRTMNTSPVSKETALEGSDDPKAVVCSAAHYHLPATHQALGKWDYLPGDPQKSVHSQ